MQGLRQKCVLLSAVWAMASAMLAPAAHAQGQTKVYNNINDLTTGWGSCTSCAGGQSNADVFWMAQFQTTPSRDGASTEFYVSSSEPYSDVLFWDKLGAQDWATHFTWDFWIYLDSASVDAQALEYDLFQYVSGIQYTFGTQCTYSTGYWDVWNQQKGKWVPTSLRCQKFSTNSWHHIVWQMHRTSDHNMHYDAVTLDGVPHIVNMTEPSGPVPAGWTDTLGVQWQLDTAAAPLTFSEWIDNVKLTIQ